MDFGQLMFDIGSSGQAASGYQRNSVGGGDWRSNLGRAMGGLAAPTQESAPVATPQPGAMPRDLSEPQQYGELNPGPDPLGGIYNDPDAGVQDYGKHLGDVFPGGLGAPQHDPMVQMFGEEQSGPILTTIDKAWQLPGNLGQSLAGDTGRGLITGNPFDFFM